MTCVIGYNNRIDSATVTGGNIAGGYPVTNVQNRFLGVYTRSTANYWTIVADFGTATSLSCAGVIATTMGAGVTVGVQGSTDNFVSSIVNVASENHDNHGGADHFFTFPPVSYRYWRFTFSMASPPPAGINVGRVFLGSRFRPEYGLSFGASLGRETRTGRQETDGGARFHRTRGTRRIVTGSFDYLSDDEAHEFRAVQSALDISNEAVLIFDDTDTSTKRADRHFLCNLDELDAIEFPYASERKVGIRMSEIIA